MRFPALFLALAAFPALADEAPATLDDIAWLAGHWRLEDGQATREEIWLPPKGGLMLGLNRTVEGGVAQFEFLRIAEEEGRIVYYASPEGRPATAFTLVEVGPFRAEFRNDAHDFPRVIRYRLDGLDVLEAEVEGEINGNKAMLRFRWPREE